MIFFIAVLSLNSFIFYWRKTALQCCVGFCHTSAWVSHRHMLIPSLLNLPPTSHPSRLSQARLSSLRHRASSHRLSALHVVMNMFQCHSLSWSQPLLPLLCPQGCCLCPPLYCCPLNSFISTIFLDSIYMSSSDQIRSVAQSCPTLCDPMNRSTPGLPVHHQLPKFTQTHVHRVNDAIQPSHPLSSPSPPAPNPSQHQSLFQ